MAKYKKTYKNSRRNNNDNDPTQTLTFKTNSEIESLTTRIQNETPAKGYVPPLNQSISFRALPISNATLRGLEEGMPSGSSRSSSSNGGKSGSSSSGGEKNRKNFTIMTDIQNACIPHALAGRDILGAARTGSGKTLSFLIPILEKLYRNKISPSIDGPASIVLSPTRELAVQIFQVLRHVGAYHNFSAGILVGGKKEFQLEQSRVGRMNIIIGTPGRILQHLEQTSGFDVSGLLILVLDEADRILDLGFREQMIRILEYLPPGVRDGGSRQTMLFSATQTKRVADLAALSLHKPEYIGVHDKDMTGPTPQSLQQSMVVIPLQYKLDTVFSFIKSHLKKKIIIFFSSCNQVRHTHALFCAMQPGIPLLALHGKIKQESRTKVYFDFLQRPHAVLFATDVAARGLDFPNVDWVVQADAPEDKEMYIHRVGRTARYNAGGKALLCLLPSEQDGMTKLLQEGKIPIKKLAINPDKTVLTVSQKAGSIVASNTELNTLAKKAYKSYIRSIQLMPNKDIFQVEKLPFDEYASSLGLASTPSSKRFLNEIKKIDRESVRGAKNVNRKLAKLKEQIKAEKLEKKLLKTGKSGDEIKKLLAGEGNRKRKHDEDDDDDDVLVLKSTNIINNDQDSVDIIPTIDLNSVTKSRKDKRICIDGSSTSKNKKITFNDDGEEISHDFTSTIDRESSSNALGIQDIEHASADYLRRVQERLKVTKEQDRLEEKERIREKRMKRKMKERENQMDDEDDEDDQMMVRLASSDDEVNEENEDSFENDGSDNDSSRSSDDDSESDVDVDIGAQEDLALSLIRSKGK
jgi:ATP-dependent RNA helicase DDX10/DBP4